MIYRVEMRDGRWNLYSPKIGEYVLENACINQVKIVLATEMEYSLKLDIVKLLMTFPHGFSNMDGETIEIPEAVEEFAAWHRQIYQRIGFLEEYHQLIDQQIMDCFK